MNALLRASAQTLNSLFNYISNLDNAVMWIRNAKYDKQLFVSPTYENIWEMKSESIYQSPESWDDCLLEGEKEIILDQISHRVKNNSTFIEKNVLLYRIKSSSKNVRYIKDWCFPVMEKQRLVAHVGVAEEISADEWHRNYEKYQIISKMDTIKDDLEKNFLDILNKEFNLLPVKSLSEESLFNQEKVQHYQVMFSQAYQCHLTPREIECSYYLCLGKTAKEIARIMDLSPRTVEKYLEKAIKSTNSSRRTELVQKLGYFFE